MPKASTAPEPIVVLGRGRAGRTLARALREAPPARRAKTLGPIFLVSGRHPRRAPIARARAVVIAVPDPAIERVAASIAPWLARGTVVLHLAGSRGPEVLLACARVGGEIGVMHPLVAMPARGARLSGTTFVIDGTAAASELATRIAEQVGALPQVAGVHGPAYHAAAAMLANGATALAASSVRVLVELGMGEREARVALGALLGTVAENVTTQGPLAALTGPIVRGDAATITRHREALASVDPRALDAYDAIAPAILAVARDAGLGGEKARAISGALRAPRARRRSR